MKKVGSFASVILVGSLFLGAESKAQELQAPLLCQRKNVGEVKNPRTRVQSLKLVKGKTCPKGFETIGSFVTPDLLQSSIKSATIAGPKGEKGDKGDSASPAEVAGVLQNIAAFREAVRGEPGRRGEQGVPGASGVAGPQGETGPQGLKGDKGERGEVGPQGPQGQDGLVGAQGAKGDKGDTGSQGAKGDRGEIGPMGPQGPAGPVAIYDQALFGGMYGTGYGNPLAEGAEGCPAGFESHRLLGTPNVDWDLFVCLGIPGRVEPIAHFGGIISQGRNPINAVTGSESCPNAYRQQQVFGRFPIDVGVAYCYTTDVSNPVLTRFGGMFGTVHGQLSPNPVTGNSSCWWGYSKGVGAGTPNVDFPFYYCFEKN
jgi:hypothetical protein